MPEDAFPDLRFANDFAERSHVWLSAEQQRARCRDPNDYTGTNEAGSFH
jgi:hypothetical protein